MPDDGWRYRSRGFIALWGRDNYAQVGEAIGVDVLNYPDLATEPETAFRVAIYWFTERESRGATAVEWADVEDFEAIRRTIYGGVHGVAQLKQTYVRILAALQSDDFAQHPIVLALNGG